MLKSVYLLFISLFILISTNTAQANDAINIIQKNLDMYAIVFAADYALCKRTTDVFSYIENTKNLLPTIKTDESLRKIFSNDKAREFYSLLFISSLAKHIAEAIKSIDIDKNEYILIDGRRVTSRDCNEIQSEMLNTFGSIVK